MRIRLYNEDCITGAREIEAESVDCLSNDPPFGIEEDNFHKVYNRKKKHVLKGYKTAPIDYYTFSYNWLKEAYRILKPTGTLYVVSGWSNLHHLIKAAKDCGFLLLNEIVWKYNFGVYTKKKFVTSHYHILRLGKVKYPTFYRECRFKSEEKSSRGRSLLYKDMEDVWIINREYHRGQKKNANKLPNELVKKMIQYATKEGDTVCDFFMGNFTTAYVAHGLNRKVIGFELNKEAFDYHVPILKRLKAGYMLKQNGRFEEMEQKAA
jgi:site-specific DNA-methyltransferase (adenine-specific)